MESEEFKQNNLYVDDLYPEGLYPEYNTLMNARASLTNEVMEYNWFRSSYFAWLDIGYGHGENIFPPGGLWYPSDLIRGEDKITVIQLSDRPINKTKSIYTIYKRDEPPPLNGAFIGGTRKAMERYFKLHRHIFNKFIKMNMMDDDQTLLAACWFEEPELFHLVWGWWYDVFELFQ